jgi:hypothetical protein
VSAGVALAVSRVWLCDDAFISFRYAEHLVNGFGLVFNPGERVEGYTNLLWTLWIALGMTVRVPPEIWSVVWGLVFHAASLGLLVAWHVRFRRTSGTTLIAVPVAALLGAVNVDWAIYATSGLETSACTFLVLAGFMLLVSERPVAVPAAGAVLALATLTRPDAIVFFVLGAAFIGWTRRPVVPQLVRLFVPFLLLVGPVVIWRWSYYGDVVPNTYYAKSANVAWFEQGLFYVWTYAARYWALVAAAGLGWFIGFRRGQGDRLSRECSLAAAFVVVYALYVARVGGDFMFARLLIPITPMLLILAETGIQASTASSRRLAAAAVAVVVIATWFTPGVVRGGGFLRGIANEWEFYNEAFPNETRFVRNSGRALRPYFDGLPVRTAFLGAHASFVYYARPRVAVECETGLTDAFIARQTLAQRGRVGHEKRAPVPYMLDTRKLHFVWMFDPKAVEPFALDRWIPDVRARFGPGVEARVLHWDQGLMRELERRGAAIDDFPGMLDAYIRTLPARPLDQVAADYEKFKRFYFVHVDDPGRLESFRVRLAGGSGR